MIKLSDELIWLYAFHNACYSAGEEKSPYVLFHGETALRKS